MALTHIVPPDAWDTHIHIFDPESFPYGLPRSYTPKAAALEEYPFQITNCTNILVVQATVQGTDPAPLLDAISENGSGHKRASLRGLTTADLSKLSEAELDRLQSAGVRGVRMHEMSWGHGAQASAHNIAEKIRVTAPIVARLGWVVDVFSDVHTWAALDHFFRKELDSDVRIVADHCGGVFPGDEALPEFKTFISLIQDGYLNIKLSGFERLYHQKEGGMESMKPIIKAIVQAGSKRIVFGSGKR